ncbi:unnamed protein product, partial [Amoebophrya sp. A120]|eukprot:GSA120T00018695001.1
MADLVYAVFSTCRIDRFSLIFGRNASPTHGWTQSRRRC